jgi:hypothetical protein
VSDPPDRIDDWLRQEVEPLPPRPGSFERISRLARRRKINKALLASAGAVVVIAAVAAAPQLVAALRHGAADRHPLASPRFGHRGSAPAASSRPARSATRPAASRATGAPPIMALPRGSSLSATTSGNPVAADFRPTSVTIAGTGTGGLAAAVLGQAGSPGHCSARYCTSLAGSSNYGASWYGVSAPRTGPPRGVTGVSQLRFLNLSDGWAFGPQLWATTDGGARWQRVQTDGLRVTDLETAGDRAFALWASCGGTGGDYAADCTSFSLRYSVAGSMTWTPVPGPVGNLGRTGSASGQPAAASLVIASATATSPGAPVGYLLAPSGQLLTGPLTGAAWRVAGRIPASCRPGTAQLDGQPAGVQLASGSQVSSGNPAKVAAGSQLLLSCDRPVTASAGYRKIFYLSATGARWTRVGSTQSTGRATWLAASSGGLAVLATTTGICYSADSGSTWASASVIPAPAGGFSYIGMTTASLGVAVPANARLGEVYTTGDGGKTWLASPVRGGG